MPRSRARSRSARRRSRSRERRSYSSSDYSSSSSRPPRRRGRKEQRSSSEPARVKRVPLEENDRQKRSGVTTQGNGRSTSSPHGAGNVAIPAPGEAPGVAQPSGQGVNDAVSAQSAQALGSAQSAVQAHKVAEGVDMASQVTPPTQETISETAPPLKKPRMLPGLRDTTKENIDALMNPQSKAKSVEARSEAADRALSQASTRAPSLALAESVGRASSVSSHALAEEVCNASEAKRDAFVDVNESRGIGFIVQ